MTQDPAVILVDPDEWELAALRAGADPGDVWERRAATEHVCESVAAAQKALGSLGKVLEWRLTWASDRFREAGYELPEPSFAQAQAQLWITMAAAEEAMQGALALVERH